MRISEQRRHRRVVRLVAVAALIAVTVPVTERAAFADTTPWLASAEARDYVRRVFKREIYPTKIECRATGSGELLVRFHTKRVSEATKPFHKWQFVITPPGGLEAAIRAIPLRDRPNLRYRIVSQDRAGNVGQCAVVYR